MPVTAEQLALVADPSTDAQTLADLAHAVPELWPTIAVHPNANTTLIEWMRQNGLPHTAPPVGAGTSASTAPTGSGSPVANPTGGELDSPAAGTGRIGTAETSSRPRAEAPSARPLLDRVSRRAKLTTGAGLLAALVAITLIVTLVIAPQQRASRAAVAMTVAADQARYTAVTDFNDAAAACKAANDDLSAARDRAKSATTTDPGALNDSTLIDKLNAAVTATHGVTACTVPTQGGDIATIQHQADDLKKALSPVRSAGNALADAVAAVTGSARAKKDDAAAAATAAALADQQAKDAVAAAARTWHLTSNDGFTFDLSFQVGSPVTDDAFTHPPAGAATCNNNALPGSSEVKCETTNLAAICSDFDASKMIAVPVTATFTATTKGFDTPLTGNFTIGTTGTYQGPDPTATNQVEVATAYSDGGHCMNASSGSTRPTWGVSWTDPVKTGVTQTYRFDVVLQKWRTPAAPAGDTALRDYLTVVPQSTTVTGTTTTYSPDSRKALTLNGATVGG